MTWKTTCAAAAALGLISHATATFVDDGDWTDGTFDWYNNSAKIGVLDGEVYSNDTKI